MSHFYEKHIFVCENIRDGDNARASCGKHNSKNIREYLKQKIKEHAPQENIRINSSGCLDRCELGPVLVSYPQGDWFTLKTELDVDKFISSYILQKETSSLKDFLLN